MCICVANLKIKSTWFSLKLKNTAVHLIFPHIFPIKNNKRIQTNTVDYIDLNNN